MELGQLVQVVQVHSCTCVRELVLERSVFSHDHLPPSQVFSSCFLVLKWKRWKRKSALRNSYDRVEGTHLGIYRKLGIPSVWGYDFGDSIFAPLRRDLADVF